MTWEKKHDTTNQAEDLKTEGWFRAACACAFELTLRCEAGVVADVPEFPQPFLWGPLESFMSKRVPSVESLLWRCRGEQNWSNQNGYKAVALCVCITGDLHTVFVRVTEREQSCIIFHSIMFKKKQLSNHFYFRKHADTFRIFLTCLCLTMKTLQDNCSQRHRIDLCLPGNGYSVD